MKRLTFSSKNIIDEWNPHIVRYVRTEIPNINSREMQLFEKIKSAGLTVEGQKYQPKHSMDKQFKEWMDKWNTAQTVLNEEKNIGVYPLAYRLDTKVSEPLVIDPIAGSKFGGLPDFRHNYSFLNPEGRPLQELIAGKWPKSENGEYMTFLGSVDLSEWLLPIHYMTANNPTKTDYGTKITESQMPFYQYSGLGYGKTLGSDQFIPPKIMFQIFYSPIPRMGTAFNSRLRLEHRYDMNLPGDKKMDIEEYRSEMSRFVKENNIQSDIPIRTLEGLTLRFDVDTPGNEFIPDEIEDVTSRYPEIFGKNGQYQFFGHPRSQQTEQRFGCQITSDLGLHRMAPIVNWTDHNQDYTYQIYGCLRCPVPESDEIYCKTDGSCT